MKHKKYHKSRRARKSRARWITSDHKGSHADTPAPPTVVPPLTTGFVPHGSTDGARMTREERKIVKAWDRDEVAWKGNPDYAHAGTWKNPGPVEGQTVIRPRAWKWQAPELPGLTYHKRCPRTGDVVKVKVTRQVGRCPDVHAIEGEVRSWPSGKLSYGDAVQHGIVRD